jgi:histidine triad (HIT) family protein
MQDCIFCKIVDKKIPADVVFEDNDILVFKDISPKAEIHLLIIPKNHFSNIEDEGLEESKLLCKMISVAKNIANSEQKSRSGYKLVFNVKEGGGQIVPHLHLLAGEKIQMP